MEAMHWIDGGVGNSFKNSGIIEIQGAGGGSGGTNNVSADCAAVEQVVMPQFIIACRLSRHVCQLGEEG